LGKGAAIKTGLSYCSGSIIIIQDGDLEYDPKDIPSVISPILNNETLVCYGSRHIDKNKLKKNYKWFRTHIGQAILPMLGGRIITYTCNILFNSKLTDVLTCYKAFDISLIKTMEFISNGFNFEAEITAKVLKQTKIKEVSISYNPRTKKQGKKIKLKDGLKIIITLIKCKMSKKV